jgi:rSAM/selenodomain-associated transferase 2
LLEKISPIEDLEIVISDGGSSDNTIEICKKYPVLVVQGKRGRGYQLNAGALASSGEILLFLHADTGLDINIFEDIKQAVSSGHYWGCCTLKFDCDALFFRMVAYFSILRSKYFSSCYGDQGIYCRRDIFMQKGPFPSIPLMEDLEFSRCMKKLKKAYVVSGKVLTSARRFEKGGPVKTICRMQLFKLLYMMGVSPETLHHWYYREVGTKK